MCVGTGGCRLMCILGRLRMQAPPVSHTSRTSVSECSAVAQLVECRTRNRESPGSNPRCYRFEVWAFSFTSRRLSRLSCINEYLAIDSGGNVSE